MRVITGEKFSTSFGEFLVYNEQSERISVEEKILFNNEAYVVKAIIPPVEPNGKWSLMV